MKIALFHDKSYKIFDNKDNIDYRLPEIKYLVVDNSTLLKGKTYTIIDTTRVENKDFRNIDLLKLTMELSYANIDAPWCDSTTLYSEIPFDSIEKTFSVYPLIRQLFGFNFYKEVTLDIDNQISIESITIKTKEKNIHLDSDEFEKELNKSFKKMNLKTDVDNLLGSENHLILKNGKWYVDKYIPNKFEYIGYNLCGMETIYILSNKQLSRLERIKNLSIDIFDKTDYTKTHNLDYEELEYELDDAVNNGLSCSGLDNILESCVYFPQLIELEKSIYKKSIAIKIKLETKDLNYTLYITEEETRKEGICLFKIINKLLQM